jgi:hypothetical protein
MNKDSYLTQQEPGEDRRDHPHIDDNPYLALRVDSLHTLATALGHTISNLERECREILISQEVRLYKLLCSADAARELAKINAAFVLNGEKRR